MKQTYLLRYCLVGALAAFAAAAFATGSQTLGSSAAFATIPALIYATPPALSHPGGLLAMLGKLGESILDANETAFFSRQLEYIKAKAYDVQYPELKATSLLPVSTEAGPGAETITYRQYDAIGIAKIVSNYGHDLPRADVSGKEFSSRVHTIGIAYGYTVQEIRAAAMSGVPLTQKKANAARRANDEKVESLAWAGDTEYGIVGFLNNANVTRASAPNDGTGSARTFASKTPAQILRDLNAMFTNVVSLTKGIEVPDTLLLPIAVWGDLNTRPRSDGTDMTVLEYFRKNNPQIKNVEWLAQAATAGVTLAGTAVAVMYRKDPDKISLEIPLAFTQHPEQAHGLEFEVPCESRCGGVIIPYPLSVYILEGI